ncbi:MAG: hypothetical protein MK180_08475 [Rhodobacteraceae bacterium]|nr:hypothetical protein [Paracoccaceae bacterium]
MMKRLIWLSILALGLGVSLTARSDIREHGGLQGLTALETEWVVTA